MGSNTIPGYNYSFAVVRLDRWLVRVIRNHLVHLFYDIYNMNFFRR